MAFSGSGMRADPYITKVEAMPGFVEDQFGLEQLELEADRAQILAQQEIHVLKGEAIGRVFGLRGGDAGLGAVGFFLGARKDARGDTGFGHPSLVEQADCASARGRHRAAR